VWWNDSKRNQKVEAKEEASFLEKKKQKTFVNLELACSSLSNVRSDPFEQKFFASFFQKRCFLTLLQLI